MIYYETSALTGNGVNEAFSLLMKCNFNFMQKFIKNINNKFINKEKNAVDLLTNSRFFVSFVFYDLFF